MKASSVISHSPSFNTYSSCRLTDIAARVIEELRIESAGDDDDDFYEESDLEQSSFNLKSDREIENEDDESESEFSFVCREPPISPIAADEIFSNGQIRPVYPLFDRSLLLGHDDEEDEEDEEAVRAEESAKSKPRQIRPVYQLFDRSLLLGHDEEEEEAVRVEESAKSKPRRLSLGRLMKEERDSSSCSSSEADDLDGLAPGTYCVWTPAKKEKSSEKCKKSNSTGSSKRWIRFRDLLNRSNSDGKDNFVFFNPKKIEEKEKAVTNGDGKVNGITKTYKQELIGVFANVNGGGMSKMVHPF